MNAINELKAQINQVSYLTESEKQSLKKYEAYIESKNKHKNSLFYEKNLINNELITLDKELELIVFKQKKIQKRKLQLYERLNIIESELKNNTGI